MKFIPFIIFLFLFSVVYAQKQTSGILVNTQIIDGDTLPSVEIGIVKVYGDKVYTSAEDKKKFDRLVRYVKKVYPFAKIAEERYKAYAILLATMTNEKEKRETMRKAEDQIKEEFYNDIKNMTFTEGKILLKLIYRQTEHTSYQLLQDYRGNVRAVFWQSIARIFGANLKSMYDPNGEDKQIEEIIQLIEQGEI